MRDKCSTIEKFRLLKKAYGDLAQVSIKKQSIYNSLILPRRRVTFQVLYPKKQNSLNS